MVEQLSSHIVEVHKLWMDYAAEHYRDAQDLAKANSNQWEQLAAIMLKTDSKLQKVATLAATLRAVLMIVVKQARLAKEM